MVTDITERKRAEEERSARFRFFQSMDRVNRAIQEAKDLEQMMSDVLDIALSLFACDRAWLVYPCDPTAASWQVPMERTKPEYPGANARGLDIPMDPGIAEAFKIELAADGAVQFGPGTGQPVPDGMAERHGFKSVLCKVLRPKVGKPWLFGLHQCSSARVWTPEEERLLREIGRRLADGLTSLLSYRDLRESEANYRRIVDTAWEGICVLGPDTVTTFVNTRMTEMFGYSGAEMIGRPLADFLFEADVPDHLRRMENRRQGLSEHFERRFRRKDGAALWTLASATPIFDEKHHFMGSIGMLTDITERKQAEMALKNVLRHARAVVMHAIVTAPEGWNEHPPEWSASRYQWQARFDDEAAAQKVLPLELSPGEDYFRGWQRAKHPEDLAPMDLCAARAFVAGAANWNQEFRATDRDGQIHQFAQTASLEPLEPGRWRVTTINIDITERKRLENRERTRASVLEKLTQGAPLAEILQFIVLGVEEESPGAIGSILLLDKEGRHLQRWAAPSLPEFYHEAFHGVEIGPEAGSCGAAAATGKRVITEDIQTHPCWSRFRDLAARAGLGSCWSEPIHSSQGHVTGVFALYHHGPSTPTAHDLELLQAAANLTGVAVERQRSEEALREQMAMGEAFFNQALSCFALLDRHLRFIRVNNAFAQGYGINAGDFAGRSYFDVFPQAQWEAAAASIARFAEVVKTKKPLQATAWPYRFVDQPGRGTTYWDSILQPICNERGEVEMVFFSSLEVTERVRGEETVRKLNAELEQRVRERTRLLEEVNEELESFSYSVSHDLRAPLRSIDGFSRALLEDYSSKLDEEGKEDLRTVRSASQQMGQLIDDMLRLSRINRGEMRRMEVNLSQIAAQVTGEFKKAEPGREVEWVIAPDCVVCGDGGLLRIALENILGNAWKYTSKKPSAKIEFGPAETAKGPAYFVRDNGCGFDMKYVHKLFGPFQRLHSKSQFPGTGIGLASVQRVVRRHGGQVWIEGKVDQGATLYFTLPNPQSTL
jgi:PAS domain S-box-containing protein